MGDLSRVKTLVLVARIFALLVLAVCAVYLLTVVIKGALSGNLMRGFVSNGITFLPLIPSVVLAAILGVPTYLVFERIKQMQHAVDVGDVERLKVLAAPEWAVAALLFSGVVPGVVFLIIRNLVQDTEEAPPPSSTVVASRLPRPSRVHSPAPEMVRQGPWQHAVGAESGQVTNPVMRRFTLDRTGSQGWLSKVRQLAQNVSSKVKHKNTAPVNEAPASDQPTDHDIPRAAVAPRPDVTIAPSAASGRATLQDVILSRVRTEETWKCPVCGRMADAPAGRSARYKCKNCSGSMALITEVWQCPNCGHEASPPVGKSNRYKCSKCGESMGLISIKNA